MEIGNSTSKNLSLLYTLSDEKPLTDTTKEVVRLSSEGFCVAFTDEHKILRLSQYGFTTPLSEKEKIEEIAHLVNTLDTANEHIFSYANFANTQIPCELFSEKIILPTMTALVDNTDRYHFIHEEITDYQLVNISAWDKDIYQTVEKLVPDYQCTSLSTALLKISASLQENIAVYVDNSVITIIVKKDKQLQAINSFYFSNEADFCYYLLAFLRKFAPDYVMQTTILLGNINNTSPICETLKRYFKNIQILSHPAMDTYHHYCDLTTY